MFDGSTRAADDPTVVVDGPAVVVEGKCLGGMAAAVLLVERSKARIPFYEPLVKFGQDP